MSWGFAPDPTSLARPVARSLDATLPKTWRTCVKIYGIKNCDTMKKARAWLEEQDVPAEFHDYKVSGIDRKRLEGWVAQVGWEALLNKSGTTFRKLPEDQREGLTERKAVELMLAQPSLIKRPVLETGKELLVGFKPGSYDKLKR